MDDELVLADSAGHTMIDIDAVQAADRVSLQEAEPARDEEPAAD